MPELPEVETIRLGLEKYVVGHVISDVEVRLARIFSGDAKNVIGAKIIGARRFGKGLVIDLDNDFSIAVHVKMTGQLIFDAAYASRGPVAGFLPVSARSSEASFNELRAVGNPSTRTTPRSSISSPSAHTHVIFELKAQNEKKKAKLYYNDVRQFGWLKVLPTNKVSELPFFKNLGLEPLKDLTLEIFSGILKNSKMQIKPLLMDQKKIAGIGNIYANDALFLAKIHPKRSASSLSKEEAKKLFDAIEKVLQKGIEAGGASEWNYVDVLGGRGKYQNFFQIYQRDGKPCKNCRTIIQKMVLGGRGTFYCSVCQK